MMLLGSLTVLAAFLLTVVLVQAQKLAAEREIACVYRGMIDDADELADHLGADLAKARGRIKQLKADLAAAIPEGSRSAPASAANTIHLTATAQHALASILCRVGGKGPHRAAIDGVLEQLSKAGVEWQPYESLSKGTVTLVG